MQTAISWPKLFLGKGKTEEGIRLCYREQLRVEQDGGLQIHVISCFDWGIISI